MKLSNFVLFQAIIDEKKDTYKNSLHIEGRRRRDRRVPREALKKFRFSSFRHLFMSRNDQALLNATGHDHRSFNMLLRKFKRTYDYYMIDRDTGRIRPKVLDRDGAPMGKPRDLTALGALGLVLMW